MPYLISTTQRIREAFCAQSGCNYVGAREVFKGKTAFSEHLRQAIFGYKITHRGTCHVGLVGIRCLSDFIGIRCRLQRFYSYQVPLAILQASSALAISQASGAFRDFVGIRCLWRSYRHQMLWRFHRHLVPLEISQALGVFGDLVGIRCLDDLVGIKCLDDFVGIEYFWRFCRHQVL